ncbi:DUF996 domain-containing protein [Thermovibrio ammonificans]|jgi:uncharacterized membrane protein|uniref:DUF996 domain-containing protein n=1 Tax=Thermovibrio ammonificans (strain DSM 15698 / JCM 12110 / HB-1) TaxID=648996 RepID=E8T4T3_THEA1|nr:DUF996 domain-containing protein [Thermovibrio ammonificans]ADU96345.1 protein of unknown function DUF996 [Thermovibrio ammonificans HB-1]
MRDYKVLGGLGAVFICLSVVPYIGPLLTLTGVILLGLALKSLGEPQLFRDFLLWVAVGIVGGAAAALLVFTGTLPAIKGTGAPSYVITGAGLLLGYVTGVVQALFLKRVFDNLQRLTGQELFGWAGKLFLAGAVLLVLGIGVVVAWAGWVVAAVAFFTAPERLRPSP